MNSTSDKGGGEDSVKEIVQVQVEATVLDVIRCVCVCVCACACACAYVCACVCACACVLQVSVVHTSTYLVGRAYELLNGDR